MFSAFSSIFLSTCCEAIKRLGEMTFITGIIVVMNVIVVNATGKKCDL